MKVMLYFILWTFFALQAGYSQHPTLPQKKKDVDNTQLKKVVDEKADSALMILTQAAKKNTEVKQKPKVIYKTKTLPAPPPIHDTVLIEYPGDSFLTRQDWIKEPEIIYVPVHDTVCIAVKKKSLFKRIFKN